MEAVGKKFKVNEIFIPEVLIASTAMKSAIDAINPHQSKSEEGPLLEESFFWNLS